MKSLWDVNTHQDNLCQCLQFCLLFDWPLIHYASDNHWPAETKHILLVENPFFAGKIILRVLNFFNQKFLWLRTVIL